MFCFQEEENMVRRINQKIHLQQTREEVYNRAIKVQENIKKLFDKIIKASDFKIGDKVLKWDSRREDKGKHGKFDSLWQGPHIIQSTIGPNAFFLQELDGSDLFGGPVNDRMLKHYYC